MGKPVSRGTSSASLEGNIVRLTKINGVVQRIQCYELDELLFERRGRNLEVERKLALFGGWLEQDTECCHEFLLRQVLEGIFEVANSILRCGHQCLWRKDVKLVVKGKPADHSKGCASSI